MDLGGVDFSGFSFVGIGLDLRGVEILSFSFAETGFLFAGTGIDIRGADFLDFSSAGTDNFDTFGTEDSSKSSNFLFLSTTNVNSTLLEILGSWGAVILTFVDLSNAGRFGAHSHSPVSILKEPSLLGAERGVLWTSASLFFIGNFNFKFTFDKSGKGGSGFISAFT